MKTYELICIVSPSMTLEEADRIIKDAEAAIQQQNGVILHSEKTAARQLAYPVKRHASGYLAVSEFTLEETQLGSVEDFFAKHPQVVRHMITIKHPVKESKAPRRKPLRSPSAVSGSQVGEKKEEKLNEADLDKKLDEILSE